MILHVIMYHCDTISIPDAKGNDAKIKPWTRPRVSLVTRPRGSLGTRPRVSLGTRPRVSLGTRPRVSLGARSGNGNQLW